MKFPKIPLFLFTLLTFIQGVSAQTYCFSKYYKNNQKYQTIPEKSNYHSFYNYVMISDVYETNSNLLGETFDLQDDRDSKFKLDRVQTLTTMKAKATIEGSTHDCEKVALNNNSRDTKYGLQCGPVILTEKDFGLYSSFWNKGIQFEGAIYKDAAYELINADYPISEESVGHVFRKIKNSDLPNISTKFKPIKFKNIRAENGVRGTTRAFQEGNNKRYWTYSYGPLRLDWGDEYGRFGGYAPSFGYVEKSECTDTGSKTKITERLLLVPAEKTSYLTEMEKYMEGTNFNTETYPGVKKNLELFFNSDMNIPIVMEVEIFAPVKDDGTDF